MERGLIFGKTSPMRNLALAMVLCVTGCGADDPVDDVADDSEGDSKSDAPSSAMGYFSVRIPDSGQGYIARELNNAATWCPGGSEAQPGCAVGRLEMVRARLSAIQEQELHSMLS